MSLVLCCLLVLAAWLLLLLVSRKRRRASMLPPGPPGAPLIGHLLRMPSTDDAFVFHQWAKTYGDVMRLEVLGQTMIILDSHQAALDLLEKRGSIYSDRPRFTLLGWDPSLVFLPYGRQFTKHRAMHQSYLGHHNVEQFKPMQTHEAHALVRNLINSTPDKYEKCMERFAVGIIAQIVAGHRITSNDDSYLRMSHMIREVAARAGMPGGTPVGFFPMLQHFPPWFPGAHHVGIANEWKSTTREIYEYPLREVNKQRETGEAMPSFILDQLERGQAEDDDLKGAAAIILVFANIRGMALNEDVYSDPTSFRPERFLPRPVGRGEPYFNATVFGFGRRICTGKYVAENSLWVAIATILASCEISKAVDEHGNIIVPDNSLTDGIIRWRNLSTDCKGTRRIPAVSYPLGLPVQKIWFCRRCPELGFVENENSLSVPTPSTRSGLLQSQYTNIQQSFKRIGKLYQLRASSWGARRRLGDVPILRGTCSPHQSTKTIGAE
ncbi:cytochrome P450 [Mycena polygramma]|nr:cytochrome P450 [Mycena polygramma]